MKGLRDFSVDSSKVNLFGYLTGVFLISFTLAFVSGSFFIKLYDSNAVTGLGLVDDANISLSASESNIDFEITPNINNGLASGSHILTANTNVPTGYNLALGTTNTTNEFTAINGTVLAPTALTDNTWGFALEKVASSTPNNTIINGFNDSYDVPVPNLNNKWANPTTNSTIKNTTVSSSNDMTEVYYGVKADAATPSGVYTNTVKYSAVANVSSIPSPEILSVAPNSGPTSGGTAIEIVGTGFAVNDQSVTTVVRIDDVDCLNVSISTNTPISGQDTIYCNTPARTVGAKPVSVTT